jgi:[protein-PII] uridylyltransferase
LSNTFDRLRRWAGGQPKPATASPGAPRLLHDLPREQLRAAISLALGPGVSQRLSALGLKGVPAIDRLERLLEDTSARTRTLRAMLREVSSPDLLVLALLLRDANPGRSQGEKIAAVREACEHLELANDSRRLVEFLFGDDLRMSTAVADDPAAVTAFVAYLTGASLFSTFTTEDHLKMLSVMTFVTLDAGGVLTSSHVERLERLFAATYDQLTKAYGDQLIDEATVKHAALNANRPMTISESELVTFLAGMPKRYLTLVDAQSVYEHVRVCRNIGADDVHCFLKKAGGGQWELTVATLDKPFLFSNICGVLAHLGMDILSGQAMTSPRGLVLDGFRFHDPEGLLDRSDPKPLLTDAVAGRVDVEALLERRPADSGRASTRVEPVISFDNEASSRYSVIEIVAQDAPGLLYRVSRALSKCGCVIEMVVISTVGGKAHDIFHVLKNGAKMADAEEPLVARTLAEAIG